MGPIERKVRSRFEPLFEGGLPASLFREEVDLDALIDERTSSFQSAGNRVLWEVLGRHFVFPESANVLLAASAVAAERHLQRRLQSAYHEELKRKEVETRLATESYRRAWRDEAAPISQAVLCQQCQCLVGSSLDEAVLRSGARRKPLGFVGVCPYCGQPTLLVPQDIGG